MTLIDQIKETGIVAVIRGASKENILPIANALKSGGVTALEITVETPGVLSAIEKLRAEFGDEVIVGAGTVLDPETARATIMAGARFVFSPTVNKETIKMTKRYGVLSIPGALTPTEILTAYENGADLIKVFPAYVFGPKYLKDIHGPLPQIPLMPTGGVNLENLGDFVRAGAVAAGIGSNLVNTKREINEQYLEELEQTARAYSQAFKEAKRK
jgi:2-dehydro-3-deoxyphosphogluconate aldolase / (4S)-4-hydroxy-2-oxoglutarate aldolase